MGKEKKKEKERHRDRHPHGSDKRRRRDDSDSSDEDSMSDSSDESRSRSRSPVQRYRKRSRSPGHRERSPKYRSRKRSDSDSSSAKRSRSSSKSKKKYEKKSSKSGKKKERDPEELREEQRQQKELIKALETPVEKRARRLAKKEAKERRRKEKMGWDKDYLGYTNADNPFGDEHLLDTFTWGKKLEKEGKKNLTKVEIQHHHKQKMDESRRELEKVKKRRLEREKEDEEREKERETMQREKEVEYFREWEKQEDSFHLNQAKMRSKIRIQDGRAKPIDLLAKYINAEDDDLAIEMHEPYTYLYGLTIPDLEDLLEDIKVYLELEEGKNADYWRDIITVTKDELSKLKKLDTSQREFHDRREGINESVNVEVATIFKGKTTNQLVALEVQMKNKLKGGEGVDVGYWESLLQQLKAHVARTRLRERHQDVLRQKLFKLKQEQGIESQALFPSATGTESSVSRESTPHPETSMPPPEVKVDSKEKQEEPKAGPSGEADEEEQEEEDEDEPVITEEDLEEQAYVDYEAGKYSPRLQRFNDLEIDTVVYNPADDMKKLELARQQVKTLGQVRLDGETEFEKKAREGMNDEEATFSVEVALDQQAFLWSDKYRPRKPRFFNRVHTGFEWNKYNQTHYDIDNPPPKIVQGYKFNIFYPDLIDKTETPQYTLTPIDGDKDFATLKFHAGPPYEDIAFKIVNREWEYSYKHGFRCQFQNNIFQLWFHFKRYRYRR
ncbi:cactin-like [Mizuhopecten yessoensis]|uniref:Splicing factor Cactin n=1 Tax=Mizuhopecten yessoensis TaxID=6573 RepID=A0A210QBP2_MIZYE|nr:cactin-like [Mizuhopecten yessoensis]OWF46150.1 Cactin [Mizuhopecten yessoensis]